MQLVLAATDGSEGGDRAVDMAATLAKSCDAGLLIVTVMDGSAEGGVDIDALARAEGGVGEGLELVANAILHHARERACRQGVASVTTRFGSGDPASVILDAVRQTKADVVVVGRRGRGRLAGLLLGSVSQKLASLAPSAVLVVP